MDERTCKARSRACVVVLAFVVVVALLGCEALVNESPDAGIGPDSPLAEPGEGGPEFTQDYRLDARFLGDSGTNPWFPLKPDWTVRLRGREDGHTRVMRMRVLRETREIAGVRTRAVEELWTSDGKPERRVMRYLAFDRRSADIYVLGETNFRAEGGRLRRSAAWSAGVRGAKAGLLLPGTALAGARYFVVNAPGVSQVRAEVRSVRASVETTRKVFDRCVALRLTSPRSDYEDTLYYAPGIGPVKQGRLEATTWKLEPPR